MILARKYMMEHCVYIHKQKDTGDVFYVGLGLKTRPYSIGNRNVFWKRVAKKHGFSVEVLYTELSIEDAKEIEIILIAYYRKCGYRLANISNGGEGRLGMITPPEVRQKQSLAAKGKPKSAQHKLSMSLVRKGKPLPISKERLSVLNKGANNPMFGVPSPMTGKHHTTETKEKIAQSKRGKIRPEVGDKLARSYPSLINRVSGEVIPAGINVSKLSRDYNLSTAHIRDVILGKRHSHRNWILSGSIDG